MTLQDLGSIGELIGAIATVATLAYLAVQIRQNSSQMREATRASQVTSIDRTVESFARYRTALLQPGIAELYTQGVRSYSDLSFPDKIRFRAVMEECFFAYSAMHERAKQGLYSHETWSSQVKVAALALGSVGGAEWWAERKSVFPQDFTDEMDRIVTSLPVD